jgi:hypothetical protein
VSSILLVGTVSNVGENIERELNIVLQALARFQEVDVFLVESDSTDNTIEVLNRLKQNNSNFNYVSKGNLKELMPNRIERLTFCRNIYVAEIRLRKARNLPMYVAVADLDGMNYKLNKQSVESCFHQLEWDVVAANQIGGYYDIYALRSKNWQDKDCFKELDEFRQKIVFPRDSRINIFQKIKYYKLNEQAKHKAIYSKMVKINVNSPWIKVESAFGGFAIYKSQIFLKYNYSEPMQDFIESEHVIIHRKLAKDGYSIYINPSLINARWNMYNLNKFFLIRKCRNLFRRSNFLFMIYKKLKLITQ